MLKHLTDSLIKINVLRSYWCLLDHDISKIFVNYRCYTILWRWLIGCKHSLWLILRSDLQLISVLNHIIRDTARKHRNWPLRSSLIFVFLVNIIANTIPSGCCDIGSRFPFPAIILFYFVLNLIINPQVSLIISLFWITQINNLFWLQLLLVWNLYLLIWILLIRSSILPSPHLSRRISGHHLLPRLCTFLVILLLSASCLSLLSFRSIIFTLQTNLIRRTFLLGLILSLVWFTLQILCNLYLIVRLKHSVGLSLERSFAGLGLKQTVRALVKSCWIWHFSVTGLHHLKNWVDEVARASLMIFQLLFLIIIRNFFNLNRCNCAINHFCMLSHITYSGIKDLLLFITESACPLPLYLSWHLILISTYSSREKSMLESIAHWGLVCWWHIIRS